jgi:hypothetical protein
VCSTIQSRYAIVRRLVTRVSVRTLDMSYHRIYRLFDKGMVEFIGPFGIVHSLTTLMDAQRIIQTGFVYHYAGFILLTLNSLLPIMLYVIL